MNDVQETKPSTWADCGGTKRDRRNQRKIILWMLAWMVPWLTLTLGIKKEWFSFGPIAMIALVVITLMGVKMLFSYHHFLREADELRRKIELDALAIAVGISVVSSFSYATLERAGVVGETDILSLMMIMMASYSISVVIGLWRYGYR